MKSLFIHIKHGAEEDLGRGIWTGAKGSLEFITLLLYFK